MYSIQQSLQELQSSLYYHLGINNPSTNSFQAPDNPDVRLISNPSASGYGSATAVAKLYGIVTNGGTHEGKKLLRNKDTIQKLAEVLTEEEEDKVMVHPMAYGRGFSRFPTPDVSQTH